MNIVLEQAKKDMAVDGVCDVGALFDEIERLDRRIQQLEAQHDDWMVTAGLASRKEVTARATERPKGYVTYDWIELLNYAGTIGIAWNTAYDALFEEGVPPTSGEHSRDLYVGVCEDYGWQGLVQDIVDGFLVDKGVVYCTITK